MGSAYSFVIGSDKDWYVYIRRLDTDSYDREPWQTWKNIGGKTALARFKHEIYAYSLGLCGYDQNTKAIYLYCGSTRILRCGIMNNQVVVESSSHLLPFLEAKEEIAPGRGRDRLFVKFQGKWFKNYARLSMNSVGYVFNEKKSYLDVVKNAN